MAAKNRSGNRQKSTDHQGPSDYQGRSQLSGPSEYQGPLKFQHFIFHFFFFVGEFGSSRKTVGQIRGLISFGQQLPWAPGSLRPSALANCLLLA